MYIPDWIVYAFIAWLAVIVLAGIVNYLIGRYVPDDIYCPEEL